MTWSLFVRHPLYQLKSLWQPSSIYWVQWSSSQHVQISNSVWGGSTSVRAECMALIGFTEGKLPFTYLGLPITASKLSKVECMTLVERITGKITTWASRHISYAGRLVLVNSVLFGIFNFWAQVFMLPQAVIDKVTQLCRNFIWGGEGGCRRVPYVS